MGTRKRFPSLPPLLQGIVGLYVWRLLYAFAYLVKFVRGRILYKHLSIRWITEGTGNAQNRFTHPSGCEHTDRGAQHCLGRTLRYGDPMSRGYHVRGILAARFDVRANQGRSPDHAWKGRGDCRFLNVYTVFHFRPALDPL